MNQTKTKKVVVKGKNKELPVADALPALLLARIQSVARRGSALR